MQGDCYLGVRRTRLLSAPPGRRAAGSVAGSVEGGDADHVGGVARQVLQLHPSLGHEQRPEPLRLVLALELPKVNLRGVSEALSK